MTAYLTIILVKQFTKENIMKKLVFLLAIYFSLLIPSYSGMIYQNFEKNDEAGWDGSCHVEKSEEAQSGSYSFQARCNEDWGYFFVRSQNGSWRNNLIQKNNDRLTFWIYALPVVETDNNIAVKIYDQHAYNKEGAEVWTDHKAIYGQWTKLTILFSQFPADLRLDVVDKIEFKTFYPGIYRIDDIQAVRENYVYQSFENQTGSIAPPIYGSAWNGAGFIQDKNTHDGNSAWKMILYKYWGGCKIQPEFSLLYNNERTFAHICLDDGVNDYLSFWVYAVPQNGLDNNLNVQFYDHGIHKTDKTKAEFWTSQVCQYKTWTRIVIPFSAIKEKHPELNLKNLHKIQIQMYWPGTYYLDQIQCGSDIPAWDIDALNQQSLEWNVKKKTNNFVLEKQITGDSNWTTVHSGSENIFDLRGMTAACQFRVRSEEFIDSENTIPYVSGWSDVLQYIPERNQVPQKIPYISANDTQLWRNGRPFKMHGVNMGNYFLLEPWMLGLNGKEYKDQEFIENILAQRFASEKKENLLQAHRQALLSEKDFHVLSQMNINFIRLPLYYKYFQDENGRIIEKGFDQLDQILNWGEQYGIYILLDMHGAPGSQSICFHTGKINFNKLFDDIEGPIYQEKTVALWTYIAKRYKDRPIVLGYDLLNEPLGVIDLDDPNDLKRIFDPDIFRAACHKMWGFYDRLYQAIRQVDSKHIIVMESLWEMTKSLPLPTEYNWENIVYQYHYYHWDKFNPDPCVSSDDPTLAMHHHLSDYIQSHENYIKMHSQHLSKYQEKIQVPVMIGEFTGFFSRDVWQLYLNTFDKYGWSWAMWSYKVSDNNSSWGLVIGIDSSNKIDLETDSYDQLLNKMMQSDFYHCRPNQSIVDIIRLSY